MKPGAPSVRDQLDARFRTAPADDDLLGVHLQCPECGGEMYVRWRGGRTQLKVACLVCNWNDDFARNPAWPTSRERVS